MKFTTTIKKQIFPSIWALTSFVCIIYLANGRGCHCLAKGQDASEYSMEWVGEPEASKGPGEKKPVSAVTFTGDEVNQVTITKDFSHSFSFSGGAYLDLGNLLKVVKVKFGFDITTKKDRKTALSHQISFAKHSKAIVMFRENLVKLKGRAKKVYKNSWFSWDAEPEEVDVELKATEVDVSGAALGTFSVDYMGTDRYKHPDYYHIINRTLDTDDALPVDDKIKSPYECAERAELYEKLIAVYDVEKMKCLLLYEKKDNGSSFDREGYELGEFNYVDNADLDASQTFEKRERDRWIKERRCDVIHMYKTHMEEENDDEDEASVATTVTEDDQTKGRQVDDEEEKNKTKKVRQRYLCKSFSRSPGKVIMMKRLKKREKVTKEVEKEPEVRASTRKPKGAPAETHIRALKPVAPASHPKFYQINGRQYEPPEVAAGSSQCVTANKKISDVSSSFECGEQAMQADKHLAVYKPREKTCLLMSVVWNYGKTMDTNGKQLGPFYITKMHEVDMTNDAEKSKQWAEQSNTNCDIIHETNVGSYSCRTFEVTANDTSIVLIRHLDSYEIKRISRCMKDQDYDNILFSRSQHPDFYSIKGRDYPDTRVMFKTITRVNTSRICGDLTLRNDKYLAIYKPKEKTCILKEVDTDDGQAFDRWNHRLGSYDLPKYTIHRTESGREHERWVDLTECDFIHAKEDGTKHCKGFPTAEDSILMLRRIDKD